MLVYVFLAVLDHAAILLPLCTSAALTLDLGTLVVPRGTICVRLNRLRIGFNAYLIHQEHNMFY